MTTFTFQGSFEYLEIARGHDGFLRGAPDPALLVAVYLTDGHTVRLMGRTLHRFRAAEPFPSRALPEDAAIASAAVTMAGPFRYVALVVALEEDGGDDVQRLFGALERHRHMAVWDAARDDVEPYSFAGVPEAVTWQMPMPVELEIEGAPAAASCRSDKWIGAVCWTMRPRALAQCSEYRLPFLAPDRRNDWTATLAIVH